MYFLDIKTENKEVDRNFDLSYCLYCIKRWKELEIFLCNFIPVYLILQTNFDKVASKLQKKWFQLEDFLLSF